MRPSRLVPLTVLALLPGCSIFSGGSDADPDYASEASTNLKRGDQALESGQYQLAEKYYEYVKTKFPFLEASRQAELRLGDVSFERQLWTRGRGPLLRLREAPPHEPQGGLRRLQGGALALP